MTRESVAIAILSLASCLIFAIPLAALVRAY